MREELSRARKRLKKTSTLITELLSIKYKDEEIPAGTNSFFCHWFEDDLNFADRAEGLVKQLEDTIKRSYDLAITKLSDPTNLGARPKDTYIASHQPSLEEEAAPAPERTKDWVHMSKFEDSRKEDLQQDNLDQKIQRSVTFDVASGQPPDYVQTMRMQQIVPQQANLSQYGYTLFNLGSILFKLIQPSNCKMHHARRISKATIALLH